MIYKVYGLPDHEIDRLVTAMVPLLKEYGINHEYKNFVALPPVRVYDENGEFYDEVIALECPAFAPLRADGKLQEFLEKLSRNLRLPITAVDAPVEAAVRGETL